MYCVLLNEYVNDINTFCHLFSVIYLYFVYDVIISTANGKRVIELFCVPGLDDDMRVDADERNGNKSDSDSDDVSSRQTINENGYQQPVETPYMENSVEELGQVCRCSKFMYSAS